MKYHTKRLIIWRSLVQAKIGPRRIQAVTNFVAAFFMYLRKRKQKKGTTVFGHSFL